ncbi:cyclic GMP-AMP synthase DncV-like nucleotidyltransferase [Sphingobium baderi]|uniref:cyclic GMP-AMP synthase DncV-like nucleotidyltransferase n=1 Tax=Sphingobium baderi TaxID=1332080 RepID=UPI002B4005E5|nr:hypothetical protein [Sphingobium baderi]WRD76357.1 hypothetical protein QQ987_16655 [Sphingobium baderi]
MGHCGSLFHSTNIDKQTLHRRITPSDDQVADQQEYWNDLADYLKSDLKQRSSCPITTWIQGSYKFATQIRPGRKGLEYDIDLGVYFAWEGKAEDGEHSALVLKEMVQESLRAYAQDSKTDATGITDPKEFCSRIRFSEHFHIDVPAYHEWDDTRKLASASDGFVDRDPYTIWEWWLSTFGEDERPRARRMVRYLKMWASLKFNASSEEVPSSIMLTVLIAYAYASLDLSAFKGDDELFAALVSQIDDDLCGSNSDEVMNPVDENENLNRMGNGFGIFKSRLKDLTAICERAVKAEDRPTSADIWSEAFEHFFPLPDVDELQKVDEATGSALVVAFVPEVEIAVTLPTGKGYTLKNAAANIPKGSILNFRVFNFSSAPAGALIRWVVRNEGAAAEAENDLGHFNGLGHQSHKETAEYKGRHFMDVTVSVANRTVGLRRVPVSVISNSVVRGATKRLFRRA